MRLLFSQRLLRSFAGLGAASLLLLSCTSQPESAGEKELMHNDFDSLAGWLGVAPQPSLTREQAHSGSYSIKVDANTEYSIGYTKPLGEMSDTRVNKIKVEAWVRVPNPDVHAALVTTFGEAGAKPLSWNGFDVVKATTKYGEWTRVSEVLDVPAATTAGSLFNIYLWRTNSTLPIYLDDLTVSAVK